MMKRMDTAPRIGFPSATVRSNRVGKFSRKERLINILHRLPRSQPRDRPIQLLNPRHHADTSISRLLLSSKIISQLDPPRATPPQPHRFIPRQAAPETSAASSACPPVGPVENKTALIESQRKRRRRIADLNRHPIRRQSRDNPMHGIPVRQPHHIIRPRRIHIARAAYPPCKMATNESIGNPISPSRPLCHCSVSPFNETGSPLTISPLRKNSENRPPASAPRLHRLRNLQHIIPRHQAARKMNPRSINRIHGHSPRTKSRIRQIPNPGERLPANQQQTDQLLKTETRSPNGE